MSLAIFFGEGPSTTVGTRMNVAPTIAIGSFYYDRDAKKGGQSNKNVFILSLSKGQGASRLATAALRIAGN